MTRFEQFTIAMLKAIYRRQTLINCHKCSGKDKNCDYCYGFGALPSIELDDQYIIKGHKPEK